ncbi:MAG: DUF2237 domain-containing protein [Burkholderiaceae bacterium]|jgi:uncharacterized protein (DUF2237 family)|uniref:DUF2237 family protein n=1 Tax=Polynucleobacter sp. MWH-Loch1C5 TaxID=2689108 RepID=UPI001C0D5C68|nr:DUF2237 domain-containing protein [Polynucleobacter sp. MWH-Loch1C5]MBU3543099.1 DUF2237 domain-containing protein [Polynucleobacter sp. MWH-Loch1C5]NBV00597.1 DUF2237 domain-containing protein [Burkholderiaceae bacterium]
MSAQEIARNVLGEPLSPCSFEPLTGFYRDGCCKTGPDDVGSHLVCAIMSDEFLQFSYARGNDLITPRPEWRFAGLQAGDQWCLCLSRWLEALEAGCAPKIKLESTHLKALERVDLETLKRYDAAQTV